MAHILYDLVNFLFPVCCPVCGAPLAVRGEILCLKCEFGMPRTNYTHNPENPVAQLFWGRIRIEMATSLFRFEKGSAYQPLLHLLKYRGEKRIGTCLGRYLGRELLGTEYVNCDIIVPVPLHKKKQRKRGYNQAEVIAEGVSEVIGIPVMPGLIQRVRFTSTQTRKGRYERFENMERVFRLSKSGSLLHNVSILLIDDVVTTGSTLEQCAEVLLHREGVRIFVATVACA